LAADLLALKEIIEKNMPTARDGGRAMSVRNGGVGVEAFLIRRKPQLVALAIVDGQEPVDRDRQDAYLPACVFGVMAMVPVRS
jgi:hypothetical protein